MGLENVASTVGWLLTIANLRACYFMRGPINSMGWSIMFHAPATVWTYCQSRFQMTCKFFDPLSGWLAIGQFGGHNHLM